MELNSGVVRAWRIGGPPRVEGSLPEIALPEGSWKGTACHSDLANMRGGQTLWTLCLKEARLAGETLSLKQYTTGSCLLSALGSPILGGSFGSPSVVLSFPQV